MKIKDLKIGAFFTTENLMGLFMKDEHPTTGKFFDCDCARMLGAPALTRPFFLTKETEVTEVSPKEAMNIISGY
jgi:hypothetical protein